MRAGVNECVAEPLDADRARSRRSARVAQPLEPPSAGQVFAIIGAKGGVGATTVAVNLADGAGARRAGADAAHRSAPGARRCRAVARRRAAVLGRRRTREHPSARRGVLPRAGRRASRPASTCWPRPTGTWSAASDVDARPGAGRLRGAHSTATWCSTCRGRTLPMLDALEAVAQHRRRRQPGTRDGPQRQPPGRRPAPALRQGAASCSRQPLRQGRRDRREDIEKVVGRRVSYIVPSDYRAALRALNGAAADARATTAGWRAAHSRELSRDLAGCASRHGAAEHQSARPAERPPFLSRGR